MSTNQSLMSFTAFIRREADGLLPKAELEQLRREPTPPLTEDDEALDDETQELEDEEQSVEPPSELTRRRSVSSIFSTLSAKAKAARAFSSQKGSTKPWRDPEVRRDTI